MAVHLVPTSLYLSAKDTLTHNCPQLSPLHGECAEVEGDQDLAEHLSPGPRARDCPTSSVTAGCKALPAPRYSYKAQMKKAGSGELDWRLQAH